MALIVAVSSQLLVYGGEQLPEVTPVLAEIPHSNARSALELDPSPAEGLAQGILVTRSEPDPHVIFEAKEARLAHGPELSLLESSEPPSGQAFDGPFGCREQLLRIHREGAGGTGRVQAFEVGVWHGAVILELRNARDARRPSARKADDRGLAAVT